MVQDTDAKRTEKDKPVNLNDASLEGKQVAHDTEADYYSRIAPPPAGIYGIKMFRDKEGWKESKDSPGDYYCGIEAKIVDCVSNPEDKETYLDYLVYWNIGTTIPRGKAISSAGHLLARFGAKGLEDTNTLKVARGIDQIISKEMVVYVWIDWRASQKGKDGEWNTLRWSMDEFPRDEMNQPIPWIMSEGQRVNAQAKITNVYGRLADAQAVLKGLASQGSSNGRGTASSKGKGKEETAPIKVKAPKQQEEMNDADFTGMQL